MNTNIKLTILAMAASSLIASDNGGRNSSDGLEMSELAAVVNDETWNGIIARSPLEKQRAFVRQQKASVHLTEVALMREKDPAAAERSRILLEGQRAFLRQQETLLREQEAALIEDDRTTQLRVQRPSSSTPPVNELTLPAHNFQAQREERDPITAEEAARNRRHQEEDLAFLRQQQQALVQQQGDPKKIIGRKLRKNTTSEKNYNHN